MKKSIVLSLKLLSIQVIKRMLSCCLNIEDQRAAYLTVGEYVNEAAIPMHVIQDLLNHMLDMESDLEASTKFASLQVMLRPQLQKLRICIFPTFYHETILEIILNQGSCLTVLDLSGIFIREDRPENATLLAKIGLKLSKLKHLTLPYLVMNDHLIRALQNYQTLITLRCPGDYSNINDRIFIGTLSKITQLELLNIGGGKADEKKIHFCLAKLLAKNRSLQSFENYNFVGNILTLFQTIRPGNKTRLTHVIDTFTTATKYDAIRKSAPIVETLELQEPVDQAFVAILSKDFKHLKTLRLVKINCLEFQKNETTEHSLNWQNLTIQQCKGTFNLTDIFRISPNLEKVTLIKTEVKHNWMTQKSTILSLNEIFMFRCGFCTLFQLKSFLRYLLENSKIEKLLIESCFQLSDDDFQECGNWSQSTLQLLILHNAQQLTVSSAKFLIESIPSLRQLGTLDRWNISDNDLLELQNFSRILNKNIQLVTNQRN